MAKTGSGWTWELSIRPRSLPWVVGTDHLAHYLLPPSMWIGWNSVQFRDFRLLKDFPWIWGIWGEGRAFFFNGSSRGYWAAADSRYVTRFMVSAETTLLPQWLRKLLEVTSTLNWASKMSEVYFLNTLFHNVNSANYELSNLLPETPKTRTNSDRHE